MEFSYYGESNKHCYSLVPFEFREIDRSHAQEVVGQSKVMIIGPKDEVLIDVIDNRHEVLVPAGIESLADCSTSIHLTRSQLELDVRITRACAKIGGSQ